MNNPQDAGRLTLELKAEMTRQQLTAADIADRCGLSVHQVGRRLSGAVDLTVDDALKMAAALGVPLYRLMQRAQADMNGRAA